MNWRLFGKRLSVGVVTCALLAVSLLPAAPAVALSTDSAAIASVAAQQSDQGVVRPGGADLYDLPNGSVIDTLPAVSFVSLHGRSGDSTWLVVSTAAGATGWVQTSQVIAYNIAALPVMDGEVTGEETSGDAGNDSPAAQPTATERIVLPSATPTTPPTNTPTSTPTFTPSPTPTLTPTPTPSPTPLPPTSTNTPTTAPTATRSPNLPAAGTLSPRDVVVGVVNVRGATLGSEPGEDDGATLSAGATVTLIARNEAGNWVQVRRNDGSMAWLPRTTVVAFGVDELPVVGADSADAVIADEVISSEDASTTDAPTGETAELATVAAVATTSESAGAEASTDNSLVVETGATGADATVLLTGGRLNIRFGPGEEYTVLGKALPDETVSLLGRTEAGDWLRIAQQGTEGATGWVNATYIETTADIAALPVEGTEAPTTPGSLEEVVPAPTPAPSGASSNATGTQTANVTAPLTPVPSLTPASIPSATPRSAAVVRTAATGLQGNIVFQDGRDGIWLLDLDNSEVRRLTSGFDPSFSPDGRTIAFVRGDGSNNGIYTIGIDGSNERKIWGEGEILRHPKYSPDGRHIVFSRLSGEWKCYNLEFLGCITLRQLIAWFPEAAIPAVSKAILGDAERLSFPNWGISRVGAQGGDFLDIHALDSAIAPDWNQNGIVYQSNAGLEITTDASDGETRSIFHGGWDHDPDWQPGGEWIVYTSREGSHWEIWRVTPDGGGIVALTRPETTLVNQLPSNVAPAWSPDGSRIVYLSNRADDEEAGAWRLWTMNADGSDKRRLPVEVPIDYSFAAEQVADWGPAVP